MMNKRLKPEFVACLKKCIDDHSTYKTDELDRKQILKRSVRELERMKNGAERKLDTHRFWLVFFKEDNL